MHRRPIGFPSSRRVRDRAAFTAFHLHTHGEVSFPHQPEHTEAPIQRPEDPRSPLTHQRESRLSLTSMSEEQRSRSGVYDTQEYGQQDKWTRFNFVLMITSATAQAQHSIVIKSYVKISIFAFEHQEKNANPCQTRTPQVLFDLLWPIWRGVLEARIQWDRNKQIDWFMAFLLMYYLGDFFFYKWMMYLYVMNVMIFVRFLQ